MSIITDIETAGKKVGEFFETIATGASDLLALYKALSGPMRAIILQIAYDAFQCFKDADADAAAVASGNVSLAITLSEQTYTDFKKLIADAKADEPTLVADFKALGWKL